jgi:putative sigma-54 modulation protein
VITRKSRCVSRACVSRACVSRACVSRGLASAQNAKATEIGATSDPTSAARSTDREWSDTSVGVVKAVENQMNNRSVKGGLAAALCVSNATPSTTTQVRHLSPYRQANCLPNRKGETVQVVIRSRNVELTERLRTLAEDKVTRVTKYFPGMDHAEITFFEEKNPRISKHDVCEVTLHGHGHHIRAKATAIEPFAALDLVVDKLAHQLAKTKDKLVTRHHDRHHHYGRRTAANKGGVALLEPEEIPLAIDPSPDEARIVKVKQFAVAPMTADEAVLKMDLLQHDFFLFTNAETGRSAVVYRRDDGHLGLIDAMA